MTTSALLTAALLITILANFVNGYASQQGPYSEPEQSAAPAVQTPVAPEGQESTNPSSASQTPASAASPPVTNVGEQLVRPADSPKGASIWTQANLGAIVSLLAAIGSFYYFRQNRDLSRNIADRTVTFEAQKLLLEINKQFIADPSLFAIYDDNPKNQNALASDPKLKAKVEALGYMKLNIYEIVFAKLPDGSRDGPWKGYFLDSMDRCSVLAEELKSSRGIYHPNLLREYDEWVKDVAGRAQRAAASKQANFESKAAWLESDNSKNANKELGC
jgi:hypothetical protein